MSEAPRHRWFQFSLRTAFVVVTIFAVCLGWELNLVHKRARLRQRLEAGGATFMDWTEWQKVKASHPERAISYRTDLAVPSAYRWIFGDRPVGAYWLCPDQFEGNDADLLRDLFPEAEKRGKFRPKPGGPDEFDPHL